MNDKTLPPRRSITFAQAEGAEPLPSQLQPRTISQDLRLALWAYLHTVLEKSESKASYDLADPMLATMRQAFVYFLKRPIDEFVANRKTVSGWVKTLVLSGTYVQAYGLVEFLARRGDRRLADNLNRILAEHHAPYRMIAESLVPISSEEEGRAIEQAFADATEAGLGAARQHLRVAAAELGEGNFAASVRESIHAVESTARVLEPSAELSKALASLERSVRIHPALKRGFAAIYGYTSDEDGIRHALLDDASSKVDETDAVFMLGACASFVSYLIGKAGSAGLLK
jgi:hypothetical protein